ncbi:hypothetical protein LJ737_04440 [Hymenobacter sp. 15J16-1T3B]|uniref:hypothetical protein n=1 Tax=Hymenobacter sp. 15J16-1T3B TaxID=2886941 RepID=UPI001D103F83|nr:hypothetical protein [Hymenobacter sp. 15J16-1T3B]MCC3156472.1 hypothetical protein [Hymenobacter sp. 15J16-1T3B]
MSTTLPPFDQVAMDRRFVWEVQRLLDEGVISSFRELAAKMEVNPSLLSLIERGTNHANQRLLYELHRHCPVANVPWVLLGEAATGRPEPAGWPKRQRGRPWPQKAVEHAEARPKA